MSLNQWLHRLARIDRKRHRRMLAANVKRFRRRNAAEGFRRVDLLLTGEQFAALMATRQPGETYSGAVGRMLDGLTGNRKR